MDNQEVIETIKLALSQIEWEYPMDYAVAFDMAVSALQEQDSRTKRCATCKHNPTSKKWPCVDCDMKEPADRWEPKDVPDTNVSDTVSRQAAIDALMDEFKRVPTTAIRAKNRIDRLPSAQPEIIHCRDCKHHHYESKGIPYCDRIDYGYGWKDDDFCSRAERRTGNANVDT
jgi:ribosomal protein L37AE/L43A